MSPLTKGLIPLDEDNLEISQRFLQISPRQVRGPPAKKYWRHSNERAIFAFPLQGLVINYGWRGSYTMGKSRVRNILRPQDRVKLFALFQSKE